jgi:phage shock protein A
MAKGIFARMTDIIKSNINELLDRAEEPDKMIRQMVREMEEAVSKATASVGTAVANQKRLERHCNEKAAQAEDWQRNAERAVESGQDDLARRALERKAVLTRAADDLKPALDDSRQTAEQLREQLRELKTKLEEARTRQGTLVARHRAAEARKRLAKSLSGIGNDAFSSFERFEQKVEATEAEADAHTEVAGEMESVEREIRALDKGQEIEDELSQLKTRMKGEAKAKTKTKTDASA